MCFFFFFFFFFSKVWARVLKKCSPIPGKSIKDGTTTANYQCTRMRPKIDWDIKIQMGHKTVARRTDLDLITKKKYNVMKFWCSSGALWKKKKKEYTRLIFKRSLTGFEFSFPSPRLIASPRLKNLVCPTIYP